MSSALLLPAGAVQVRLDGPGSPDAPQASIVIPAYGVGAFIRACVESAASQADVVAEIILVDDGSEEDLPAILGPALMARIRYIRQDNGGRSSARNTGILAARAEYIVFLDGDDMLTPDHAATCLGLARNGPPCDVVVPDARMFGDGPRSGALLSEVTSRREPVTFEGFMLGRCALVGTSVFRREVLLRVGGYDTSLPVVEDLHMHGKLLLEGVQYRYSDRPTYLYRRHAQASTVKDLERLHRCTLEALELLQALPLTAAQRAAVAEKRSETRHSLSQAAIRTAIARRDWAAACREFRDFDFARLPTAVSGLKWRCASIAARVMSQARMTPPSN